MISEGRLESPVGALRIVAHEDGVRFAGVAEGRRVVGSAPSERVLAQATRELEEYFAGRRTTFAVPLSPVGTSFQRIVWEALRAIPFGETRSYGALARAIDRPTASRAVGAANGANLLAILVPCHRVVGADGALTGYAGGLEMKRWLLRHERDHAAASHA